MVGRFFVAGDQNSTGRLSKGAVILDEGGTLTTGVSNFESAFGQATTLEADLLRLAASVLAADRGTARGLREEVGREITLSVPVINAALFVQFKAKFEQILRFLSRDAWIVDFRQSPGAPESTESWPGTHGSTLLFSGGLDSLAAAIEFGGDEHAPLQLISHTTHNSATSTAQRNLAAPLLAERAVSAHHQFFVSSRGTAEFDHDVENSQRTRSFVFLIIAALAARRTGQRRLLFLAENGQMAVHLALTNARVGAFSTLTAHPTYLARMRLVLESFLGGSFVLENPYVHRTKKEVVSIILSRHPELVPISNSCWRSARLTAGTHCGVCIPCYVRRVALESLGKEQTDYARDVWREDIRNLAEDDDGRRNMVDLLEFVARIATLSEDEIMNEWPELYSVNLDAPKVISMYKRFASEASGVFKTYPAIAALV